MPALTPVLAIPSLVETKNLPQEIVGRRVVKLNQLLDLDLPVPDCAVLTTDFLRTLFSYNQLEVRFRWLLEHTVWSDEENLSTTSLELQSLIKQMKWPDQVRQSFLAQHQTWLEDTYFAIRPSFISPKATGRFSQLHIQGEANVVESVLQLWANLYQPAHLKERWQEWQQAIHIPAAIIIQEMIQSKVSGTAELTFSQAKKQPEASILSTWGVLTSEQREHAQLDHFVISLKTGQALSENIRIKKSEYIHGIDALQKKSVPFDQQSAPSLNADQLKKIAILLAKVQRNLLETSETEATVEWAFDGKNFFLLHLQLRASDKVRTTSMKTPLNPGHLVNAQLQTLLKPTLFSAKIYSLNSSEQLKDMPFREQLAGVCFQSNPWWLAQHQHPQALLEDGQAHRLLTSLRQELLRYFHHLSGKDAWYILQSLESYQLQTLEFGKKFEERETNPWIGFKGALRALHQPALFDFELDVVSDVAKSLDRPIHLVLPWVRSSSELQLIIKRIGQFESEQHRIQLWLECSTPENLLNIHHYITTAITGIVINIDNVSALLTGIDPNNVQLKQFYSPDMLLLETFLTAVQKRVQLFHKPVIIRTAHSNHQVLSLIEKIGAQGYMILDIQVESTLHLLNQDT